MENRSPLAPPSLTNPNKLFNCSSNCTGNVDVIEDYVNGKLFPVGDHESLTKIIIDYLKDPEKLVGLSQKGKEICKTYDPDKIFSKWEKIIESSAKL